jgi:hypothetical protein
MYFKYFTETDAIKATRHWIEIGCLNARGKPIPVEPTEKAKKVRDQLEKSTKGSGGSVQFFNTVQICNLINAGAKSGEDMITATEFKHD